MLDSWVGLRVGRIENSPPQSQMPRRTLGSPASSTPLPLKAHLPHKAASFLFFLFSPPCHCESLSPSPQIFFLAFITDHLLSIPNNTYVLLSNSSSLKTTFITANQATWGMFPISSFFFFFWFLELFTTKHQVSSSAMKLISTGYDD